MSPAYCLEDISEMHELLNNQKALIRRKGFIFFSAVKLYFDIRKISRKEREFFNSSKYKNSINNISQEDFADFRDGLVDLHGKIERSISAISSIEGVRLFHRTFSLSRRSLEKERRFIEEKIFDFQFGMDRTFPDSMNKIIEGIEKSKLDPNKLATFDTII